MLESTTLPYVLRVALSASPARSSALTTLTLVSLRGGDGALLLLILASIALDLACLGPLDEPWVLWRAQEAPLDIQRLSRTSLSLASPAHRITWLASEEGVRAASLGDRELLPVG